MNNTQTIDEQALESERCCLAGVMAMPETLADARVIVDGTDFAGVGHSGLWAMLTAMADGGESIADHRRLTQHIVQSGILAELGGIAVFQRYFIDAATGHNTLVHAREVKAASTRRRLAMIARRFLADIDTADDPAAMAAELRARIDEASADAGSQFDSMSLYEAASQRLALLESPGESTVGKLVASGIECIDECYGGFRQGGSYVIAARPGRGKSALMKQVFNSLDIRSKAALVVSLEMEPHEFAARILSERGKIDGKFLEVDESGQCQLEDDELDRVRSLVAETKHSVIRIAAPKGRAASMEAIAAQARIAKAKYGIEVLAVDYLQIMTKSSARQSDYEFVTANSKAFKALARELGIVVLVLSQLNRGNENGHAPRRPRLSDLRDSGAIEQDADGVIMLHRVKENEVEDNKVDFELIVAKWRNDQEGLFEVRLVGKYTMFSPPFAEH